MPQRLRLHYNDLIRFRTMHHSKNLFLTGRRLRSASRLLAYDIENFSIDILVEHLKILYKETNREQIRSIAQIVNQEIACLLVFLFGNDDSNKKFQKHLLRFEMMLLTISEEDNFDKQKLRKATKNLLKHFDHEHHSDHSDHEHHSDHSDHEHKPHRHRHHSDHDHRPHRQRHHRPHSDHSDHSDHGHND